MASITHSLPAPIDSRADDAILKYAEASARPQVTATYLMIAVVCLACGLFGSLMLNFRTNAMLRNMQPLIIRINEVGSAQAIGYDSSQTQLHPEEIKYFLSQFIHAYYSRNRRTASKEFARSLLFLDAPLAGGRVEKNRQTKEVETFIANSNEEIEVDVMPPVLRDLRAQPFTAEVKFDKIYLTGPERIETKREKYVANIVFVQTFPAPKELWDTNPLGFTITYFRSDFVGEAPKP